MLISCWSAKGGSGATVVAVGIAATLARRPGGALLVDLAGDLPAALALPDETRPGVSDWLRAGAAVPPEALGRLELEAAPGLHLVPAGEGGLDESDERSEVLAALLAADPRPVVADCGTAPVGTRLSVAAAAAHSLLVVRPCYLGLRRALRSSLRPSAVVVVDEPGRALDARDVEDTLGVPVRAVVPEDDRVARAVDAGLLARRPPRSLVRSLDQVLR